MKLRISLICLIAAVGCSSSKFEIARNLRHRDLQMETAGDTGVGPVEDAEPPADSGDDTIAVVDAGCAAPSDPLEIFVDGATTATSSTGTAGCPFRRINEAIAYANTLSMKTPRTIKVKAGSCVEDTAMHPP